MSGIADGPSIRERAIPHPPPWLIIAAALLAASLAGRLMADGRMKYGLALVIAACFAPLVLFNLAAALAVSSRSCSSRTCRSSARGRTRSACSSDSAGSARFWDARPARRDGREPRLLLRIVVLCCWLTLSIAWAEHAEGAGTEVGYWWLAAFGF